MERLNLQRPVQKIIDSFTLRIKDIYKDGLVSIILYGSAASSEFAERHSNINIAIVLKDTSLPSLTKALPLINKNKFMLINPMFFTEDCIKKSTDVFPLEFLDIKENHAVLYGKDVFKDLQIEMKNLRFQCEQELKSKILTIKKMYLKTKNRFTLKGLLFKSLTSSLHILRNLVRLKLSYPSYKKEEAINEISTVFGVDTGNLRKILDARNRNARLSSKEIGDLFAHLVETLEKISDKLDSL